MRDFLILKGAGRGVFLLGVRIAVPAEMLQTIRWFSFTKKFVCFEEAERKERI
jgi:hypothetical protein